MTPRPSDQLLRELRTLGFRFVDCTRDASSYHLTLRHVTDDALVTLRTASDSLHPVTREDTHNVAMDILRMYQAWKVAA